MKQNSINILSYRTLNMGNIVSIHFILYNTNLNYCKGLIIFMKGEKERIF